MLDLAQGVEGNVREAEGSLCRNQEEGLRGANKGDKKVSFIETTMDEYEKMAEDQKHAVQKVEMNVFNLETTKEIEGSENREPVRTHCVCYGTKEEEGQEELT